MTTNGAEMRQDPAGNEIPDDTERRDLAERLFLAERDRADKIEQSFALPLAAVALFPTASGFATALVDRPPAAASSFAHFAYDTIYVLAGLLAALLVFAVLPVLSVLRQARYGDPSATELIGAEPHRAAIVLAGRADAYRQLNGRALIRRRRLAGVLGLMLVLLSAQIALAAWLDFRFGQ